MLLRPHTKFPSSSLSSKPLARCFIHSPFFYSPSIAPSANSFIVEIQIVRRICTGPPPNTCDHLLCFLSCLHGWAVAAPWPAKPPTCSLKLIPSYLFKTFAPSHLPSISCMIFFLFLWWVIPRIIETYCYFFSTQVPEAVNLSVW